MLERKKCWICSEIVVVINCHYTCKNCGFNESCHDMPHASQLGLFETKDKENKDG